MSEMCTVEKLVCVQKFISLEEIQMKNNKKGFTLVELVIVVAVMAILVAVAIPTVASITEAAKSSVNESNARTIESVIKVEEAKTAAGDDSMAAAGGIEEAINAAKLGIKADSEFFYSVTTGMVTTESTGADDEVTITFVEDGVCEVE